MKLILADHSEVPLGRTETAPTIGITDYSRRVTDEFGVTTLVPRGFSRKMNVRMAVPSDEVDALQRRLASLRAEPVTWVADDDLDALTVTGFYRDFSIDLAVPPHSFCTLTIEGMAEGGDFSDDGRDPAPLGESSLSLLHPVTIDDDVLISSSVAENDYPEWASGTTYALGARVIKGALHRVFESVAAGNVGNDPGLASGKWTDIGPTNRWAMFDQALGTLSTASSSIVVKLAAGAVTALAMLDVTGDTVRVQTMGYDRTVSPNGGAVVFLDLPNTDAEVTVTLSGAGTVSIGTFLIGALITLGVTEANPTAAITDYSRKDVDDFGEVTIVERAWAKRMSVQSLIRTDAVGFVAGRLTAVRAKPVLWIGDASFDSLTIYGFFKDFSIEVGEAVSKVSLTVEGLSKAADPRIDDRLSRAEKITRLIPMNARVREELDMLAAQVPSLSEYSVVSVAAAAAVAAWNDWVSYRGSLSPAWNDTMFETRIARGEHEREIQALLSASAGLASALRIATEVRAMSALTTSTAAQTLAAGKSEIFYQPAPPAAAESSKNDRWIDTDDGNYEYRRLDGDGRISFGGVVLTVGGVSVVYAPWAPASDHRIGQALIDAAGAQATADGRIVSFNQILPPTATAIGDLWYSPPQLGGTGELQRWNGAAWELTADMTIVHQHTIPTILDIGVAASSTGETQSGQLPASRLVQHFVGSIDRSAAASITAAATGGVAISVNNTPEDPQRGMITVTNAPGNQALPAVCFITGTSSMGGVTLPFSFAVRRVDAPPAATGGGGGGGLPSSPASSSALTSPGSNTTHQVMSPVLKVVAGSSGTVNLSCLVTYRASSGSEMDATFLAAKWQYSANGSSGWSDVSTEIVGGGAENWFSTVTPKGPREEPATVAVSQSKTGLGAGDAYFRLVGRMVAGGVSIVSVNGTATASPI